MQAEFYTDMTITVEEVERRKKLMEAAHETYSTAFRAREKAEKELSRMAQTRAGLIGRCEAARNALTIETAGALAAAVVEDSSFPSRAANINATRQQYDLLRQARAQFDAYEYADAQRAALAAKVAELESQVLSEEARLQHHEAKLLLLVAQASELNQGIRIEGLEDGVSGALRAIVADLQKKLTEARKVVRTHEGETQELQQKYMESYV